MRSEEIPWMNLSENCPIMTNSSEFSDRNSLDYKQRNQDLSIIDVGQFTSILQKRPSLTSYD